MEQTRAGGRVVERGKKQTVKRLASLADQVWRLQSFEAGLLGNGPVYFALASRFRHAGALIILIEHHGHRTPMVNEGDRGRTRVNEGQRGNSPPCAASPFAAARRTRSSAQILSTWRTPLAFPTHNLAGFLGCLKRLITRKISDCAADCDRFRPARNSTAHLVLRARRIYDNHIINM